MDPVVGESRELPVDPVLGDSDDVAIPSSGTGCPAMTRGMCKRRGCPCRNPVVGNRVSRDMHWEHIQGFPFSSQSRKREPGLETTMSRISAVTARASRAGGKEISAISCHPFLRKVPAGSPPVEPARPPQPPGNETQRRSTVCEPPGEIRGEGLATACLARSGRRSRGHGRTDGRNHFLPREGRT